MPTHNDCQIIFMFLFGMHNDYNVLMDGKPICKLVEQISKVENSS